MQFEIPEKVCDICGKSYKRKLHHFSAEFLPVIDSSNVRIRIETDNATEIYDYDICSGCANDVLASVIGLQVRHRNKEVDE